MNREFKRRMAKQEAASERERARTAPLTGPRKKPDRPDGRIKRTRKFLKEVRQELKKVAWPNRSEIVTYTVVVLVSVAFITAYVFGLDFGIGKLVLTVFKES